MGVKPFAAGHTLESLRDSDFDSNSAIGEVIDNSIQAEASNIRLSFKLKNKDLIDYVTFIDDGNGMDKDIIQNCLRLGWSSRYNDRSGIGRFGVGMTLGAIHECRRVEVYSLSKESDWLYTYLDLDEIESSDVAGTEWEIPAPVKRIPDENMVSLSNVPKQHGTILVWSKYDRAQDKAGILISELRVWIGRTFRYFIWNEPLAGSSKLRDKPVSIFVDGSEVRAIDPLYLRTSKTAFPEDPVAYEYNEMSWDWPVLDPKIAASTGLESAIIRVRLSLLPSEWRSTQGAGQSDATKKRFINMNEGFSMLRHGREVGYDWIPHFQFGEKEIDRWWGCEIHFEPFLDRAFRVKNIKRGAVPSTELKKAIADRVGPWIKQQRELISENWKKETDRTLSGTTNPVGTGGHARTEGIVKTTDLPPGLMDKGKDPLLEIPKVAKIAGDGRKEEEALWAAKFASQPFTIGERAWPGATFVDIHRMGGTDALFYNNRHNFFEVLTLVKEELKNGINLDFNAERLTVLIDLLLISYAKAESTLNPAEKMSPTAVIDHLKNNWGQYLKTYITTWQDEYDGDLKS